MIFLYTATFTVYCYSRLCSCYLDLLSFLELLRQKRKTKRGERLMMGGKGGRESFHRNLIMKMFLTLLQMQRTGEGKIASIGTINPDRIYPFQMNIKWSVSPPYFLVFLIYVCPLLLVLSDTSWIAVHCTAVTGRSCLAQLLPLHGCAAAATWLCWLVWPS